MPLPPVPVQSDCLDCLWRSFLREARVIERWRASSSRVVCNLGCTQLYHNYSCTSKVSSCQCIDNAQVLQVATLAMQWLYEQQHCQTILARVLALVVTDILAMVVVVIVLVTDHTAAGCAKRSITRALRRKFRHRQSKQSDCMGTSGRGFCT